MRIKLLVALAFLAMLITGTAQAGFPDANNLCIYKSTVTVVSGSKAMAGVRYCRSVIITTGTPTANTTNDVQLYDSSSTVVTNRRKLCGVISLLTPGQIFLDQSLDYGLTYVSSGTVQPFTLIYREK